MAKKNIYFVSGFNMPYNEYQFNSDKLKQLRTKGELYKSSSYRDAYLQFKKKNGEKFNNQISIYKTDLDVTKPYSKDTKFKTKEIAYINKNGILSHISKR